MQPGELQMVLLTATWRYGLSELARQLHERHLLAAAIS